MHAVSRYVYFMQWTTDATAPIKIGCSCMPERRLYAHLHWSPYPLGMLATAPGGLAAERVLQERFAGARLEGEWFTATPELLALVQDVARTGELPDGLGATAHEWISPKKHSSRLNEHLKAARCTSRHLADAVGAKYSTARMWSLNGVAMPHIHAVVRFLASRGVHVSPMDLFESVEPKRRAAA